MDTPERVKKIVSEIKEKETQQQAVRDEARRKVDAVKKQRDDFLETIADPLRKIAIEFRKADIPTTVTVAIESVEIRVAGEVYVVRFEFRNGKPSHYEVFRNGEPARSGGTTDLDTAALAEMARSDSLDFFEGELRKT